MNSDVNSSTVLKEQNKTFKEIRQRWLPGHRLPALVSIPGSRFRVKLQYHLFHSEERLRDTFLAGHEVTHSSSDAEMMTLLGEIKS